MSVIKTCITDVCVYSEGARVTRFAKIKSGEKNYCIDELPCRLNEDSLQFEASSGAYVQNSSTELVASRKSIEHEKILALSHEAELLSLKETSLIEQIAEIESVAPANLKPKASFEKVAQAMEQLNQFKADEFKKLNSQLISIQKQLKELQKEIDENHKNKEDEISCTKKITFELISEVDEIELKIHYLIPDASWAPAYSINVKHGYESGLLQMKAMVSQNSGEDWNGVNIKLSTSMPYSFRKLPLLKSQFIGRKQRDHARSQWRPAPADTESLFYDFDCFAGIQSIAAPNKIHKKTPVDTESRLIVLSEVMRGHSYEIDESPVFIGSGSANDLEINDGTISSKHAKITCSKNAVFITDLGSTNGTRINGERIYKKTKLRSSDIIQVGGVEILYDDGLFEGVSNTTQTNISLDIDESVSLANINPMRSRGASEEDFSCNKSGIGFGGRKRSSAPKSKSMKMKMSSVPKKRISYEETLSEGINRHSSLFMDTQTLGGRGTLIWKSNLDIYKVQMQTSGFFLESEPIIDFIKDSKLQINTLPENLVQKELDFDYSYQGKFSVNIPSSKHHYVIPLQEAECAFSLSYLCIPRESSTFYRAIKLKNPFNTPLLSGPLDIYLEKTFINSGELNSAPNGGYIKLILGEEQNIKLVRHTYFNEEVHGLMNGKNILKHRIVNEVTNRTGKEARIELRERLPYADKNHKKHIDVTLTKMSPEWNAIPKEDTDGVEQKLYFWDEKISSGESREFEFNYEIELSSKEEISGGNRREF